MIELPVVVVFELTVVVMAVVIGLPTVAAQSIKGAATAYPYGIGGNVSAPVKIILASLIFGMFLIAFFSLYLRKCLENSVVDSQQPPVVANNHRLRFRFPRGLDRSLIESFPVFLYSDVKDLKIGKGALECAVCISEFADNERLRFLPKCHHVFHPNCIDAWLASHTTCPVCRADLTVTNLDGESEIIHESVEHSPVEDSRTEIRSQNNHIVEVEDEEERPARKIPRSHSTGHSLVALGENCERYTLRLPEEVRKQMVTLKRAKSCGCRVELPLDGSSRRGQRSNGGAQGGGWRWTPDRICGRTDLRNSTMTRMPAFIAKSDSAQSSSSSISNIV